MTAPDDRHYSDESLQQFLSGLITGLEARQIELHLDTCLQCSQVLEKVSIAQDPLIQRLRKSPTAESGDTTVIGRGVSSIRAVVTGPEIGEFRCPIARELEFGRQTVSEPDCPSFQFGTSSDRAVIAPLSFRTLSRRHLLVTPLASGRIRVTSLTTKGDILINHNLRLTPGQNCEVSVPTDIWLGHHRIQVVVSTR
jgi:hypothetical protein